MDIPWAALAPLVVLAVAFVGYCLFDLSRNDVRHLPKWLWVVIVIISIPVGVIVYLMAGRQPKVIDD
jgi:hypothetical protein